ncbi:hypothetical protein BH23GEM11_BH23GEM11_05920 [soil metagenome]
MTTPTPTDLPRIPELEREFDFVRLLGIGASGIVLLAREKASGADVAVKLLRPEHQHDDDAEARLVREARMLGNLQHPSIIRLHGTRRLARGHLALVLEFVRGRTVADLLAANGPLPARDVQRVVQGMGEALDYLGRKRVVHRDLKPGNIHLDEVGGRVLLADFGIARNRDADAGLDAKEASHGTPAYMAPEQVEGGVPDGRSDLYALGLVAFEMLAGRPAWGGSSLGAMLARRDPAGVPPVAGIRPGIPPGLARAIDRCLRTQPDDRWPNAAAMLAALGDTTPLSPEERGEREPRDEPLPRPDDAWEHAPTVRYSPGAPPRPPAEG